MTAAIPFDSLEVRWMVPGRLGTALLEWFARFPGNLETRQDAYLMRPHLRGLSVKLRDGSAFEVKSYLGSPGILTVPDRGQGRMESWRKSSFPYDPSDLEDMPAGWLIVRKRRHRTWFPFAVSQGREPVPLSSAEAGCAAELTEAEADGHPWWSVGFEATGPAALLRSALQRTATLVLTQPMPAGIGLSLDNSRSYAQWLAQWPLLMQEGSRDDLTANSMPQ